MIKLILVNKKGKVIGYEDKKKCHLGYGILHRAFSIYVLNNKNQLLIQKRSDLKMLWPLHWSNTCCSHPLKGLNYQRTLKKRLKEEMGFTCSLRVIDKLYYQANYKKVGAEHELCDIVIGRYNGKVAPNQKEVADWQWLGLNWLMKDIKQHPDIYTPWFKIGLKKVEKWVKRN